MIAVVDGDLPMLNFLLSYTDTNSSICEPAGIFLGL